MPACVPHQPAVANADATSEPAAAVGVEDLPTPLQGFLTALQGFLTALQGFLTAAKLVLTRGCWRPGSPSAVLPLLMLGLLPETPAALPAVLSHEPLATGL